MRFALCSVVQLFLRRFAAFVTVFAIIYCCCRLRQVHLGHNDDVSFGGVRCHCSPSIKIKLCYANLLTLNSSKTEFLLIGLKEQLSKIQDCSLTTTHSARNLGFILDEHLTFSDQITALSKSCYYHIRERRCIRPYLDFKTTSTITSSIVHSKLDYCNSLYHNLPNCQLNRLQQIQSSLARAVVRLLDPLISLSAVAWLQIRPELCKRCLQASKIHFCIHKM